MKKKKSFFRKSIKKAEQQSIVEKKIVNAISIVFLNDNSKEMKDLLDNLKFQKENYYPETEIIIVDTKNINLLDLTKGQFILFITEYQPINEDFLHQLYINMRSGIGSYSLSNFICTDRNLLK